LPVLTPAFLLAFLFKVNSFAHIIDADCVRSVQASKGRFRGWHGFEGT
jgi:hypothetical protein